MIAPFFVLERFEKNSVVAKRVRGASITSFLPFLHFVYHKWCSDDNFFGFPVCYPRSSNGYIFCQFILV